MKNLKAPYKTQCGAIKLKYFEEYSMNTCWLEQLTDYVTEICQCKDFFMPGKNVSLLKHPVSVALWNLTSDYNNYNTLKSLWNPVVPPKKYSDNPTIRPIPSVTAEIARSFFHCFLFSRIYPLLTSVCMLIWGAPECRVTVLFYSINVLYFRRYFSL